MPDGDLIRIGQAARILGVSTMTLRRWADSGRIRHFEVGPYKERRFLKADLLAFLRERESETGEGES